jgi:hypothetical protein
MGAHLHGHEASPTALLVGLALVLPTLWVGVLAAPGPGSGPHASGQNVRAAPFSSSGGGGGSPGPSITSFTATPGRVTIPGTVEFRVNATGGTPPLAYAYTGLPSGCTSKNASSFTCSPNAAITTNVTVVVRDASGQEAQAFAPLVVLPAPSGPTLFGLPAWEVSALLAVLAAIVVGLLLWRMGRKRPVPKVATGAAEPDHPKGPG